MSRSQADRPRPPVRPAPPNAPDAQSLRVVAAFAGVALAVAVAYAYPAPAVGAAFVAGALAGRRD